MKKHIVLTIIAILFVSWFLVAAEIGETGKMNFGLWIQVDNSAGSTYVAFSRDPYLDAGASLPTRFDGPLELVESGEGDVEEETIYATARTGYPYAVTLYVSFTGLKNENGDDYLPLSVSCEDPKVEKEADGSGLVEIVLEEDSSEIKQGQLRPLSYELTIKTSGLNNVYGGSTYSADMHLTLESM